MTTMRTKEIDDPRAKRAEAELQLRDGRAWMVVVGKVDGTRAMAVAELVAGLAREGSLYRVSVDLTCAITTDQDAMAILDALRSGAPPCVDVTTAGAIGRHIDRHAAAGLTSSADRSPRVGARRSSALRPRGLVTRRGKECPAPLAPPGWNR
jgi:hypothetical protein